MEGVSIRAAGMAAKFTSKVTSVRSTLQDQGGKAVEAQVRSIRQVVITTSPVDTGRLKASWSPVSQRGDLAYGFGTAVHYAATLEYGGYPKVGPRTISMGGGDLGAGFVAGPGIYSRQAPLGFVRKALADAVPQFRVRMRNVLRTTWGGLGATEADNAPPAAPVSRPGRQTAIGPGGTNPEVLAMILASFQRGRR